MPAFLIPLILSLAPELAPHLFGSSPVVMTVVDAVVNAVASITGTRDPAAQEAAIKAGGGAASQLRVELAKVAADAQAAKDKATNDVILAQINAVVAQNAGSTSVDLAEAGNASLYVAGWRPAVGWVCAAGFAMEYVILPMAGLIAKLCGLDTGLPTSVETGPLEVMLTGMLGLGAYRTAEKFRGVAPKGAK